MGPRTSGSQIRSHGSENFGFYECVAEGLRVQRVRGAINGVGTDRAGIRDFDIWVPGEPEPEIGISVPRGPDSEVGISVPGGIPESEVGISGLVAIGPRTAGFMNA